MTWLTHESVLYFLVRVILGVLFFFQGYDKVFKLKLSGVIDYFKVESKHKNIPGHVITATVFITSLIELIGGGILVVGLFQTIVLYSLALDLIIISVAFSFLKPMWDMQALFPRLILLCGLLYFPVSWERISFDALISIIK